MAVKSNGSRQPRFNYVTPNDVPMPLPAITEADSGWDMHISGTAYKTDGWVDELTSICHKAEDEDVCTGPKDGVKQCSRKIGDVDYTLISKAYADVDPFCTDDSEPGSEVKYNPKKFEEFVDQCLVRGQKCRGVQTDGAVGDISHKSHQGITAELPSGYQVVAQDIPSALARATGGTAMEQASLPQAPYPNGFSSQKQGRGRLGRWGPNFAADPIVTRWNKNTNHMEMAIIKRFDTKKFALPGGMVEPGDSVATTVEKEFLEEAMGNPEASQDLNVSMKEKILKKLQSGHVKHLVDSEGEFEIAFDRKTGAFKGDVPAAERAVKAYVTFMENNKQFMNLLKACAPWATKQHTVYAGMVDDPRNTDNAWMETQAVWIHCNSCPAKPEDNIDDICTNAALTPATDATTATFKNVHDVPVAELYASHQYMVKDILLELQKVTTA